MLSEVKYKLRINERKETDMNTISSTQFSRPNLAYLHNQKQNRADLNRNVQASLAFKGDDNKQKSFPYGGLAGAISAGVAVASLMTINNVASNLLGKTEGQSQALQRGLAVMEEMQKDRVKGWTVEDRNDDGHPEIIYKDVNDDNVIYDIYNNVKTTITPDGDIIKTPIVDKKAKKAKSENYD